VQPTVSHTWSIDGPLDLGRTVRALTLWGTATWIRVDPTGAWVSRRTPDGPATLRLTIQQGSLRGDAWGPGADDLLSHAPGLAGLHDPGVDAIPRHHELVARLAQRARGVRLPRSGVVTDQLIAVALAQKVTGKNSKQVLRRLAYQWGERAPGPRDDLVLLPPAAQLAKTPAYAFHPLGIEGHRASLVRRIAAHTRQLERATRLPPAEGRLWLEKLRGIGPWTSGVVASTALGDADAVPVGDYKLPSLVAWNLAGEERADDDRMMALLEPYMGQRGRVVRLVKSGGRAPPKYGPRSEVRDIREW